MSIYTLRSGATAHPEDSVLQFMTDLVNASGVVNITSDLAVTQNSPLGMSVLVSTGRAYVKGSSTNAYPVRITTVGGEAVVITNNASGNPRKDAIVLYIDLSATPDPDGTLVAKLICVAGTPAASPVAPTNSEILSAIGSSNPYLRLADVTVASGATSIVNANITDQRVLVALNAMAQVLKEQSSVPATPASGYGQIWEDTDGLLRFLADDGKNKIVGETDWVPLTDGATITVDIRKGKKFYVTLGGNRTIAFSNEYSGKDLMIKFIQDSTGSRLVSQWPQYSFTFATSDVDTANDKITTPIDIPTCHPIVFSSTGTLPAGLSAATRYYAIRVDATHIKIATSIANAQAGTAIDLTSTGSGTHTGATQVRWGSNDTVPTLTTGKYRADEIGISIVSTGIYEGVIIQQDL